MLAKTKNGQESGGEKSFRIGDLFWRETKYMCVRDDPSLAMAACGLSGVWLEMLCWSRRCRKSRDMASWITLEIVVRG